MVCFGDYKLLGQGDNKFWFGCGGCSNWGTESDPDFKYHTGNTDPRGYGMCDLFDF